ncbi:DUF4214 domain-containing protein [Phaeobacter sp. J2-8]|uniref:DUF4214 domain-containing protein n=1 Tax=Phaeobacter sp. J2-8 TaxID=2931394 RepID=UPI001FD565D7|nr:DUF4214 domain-containing protein [Phaeobacter sp. J2-8]MCJ7871457.1 DUF4214 domain-containing protein [Phaeobacter sp. J2-8]
MPLITAILGSPFVINTTQTNRQSDPDITSLPNGGYVVVWTAPGQDDPDTFSDGVFGRIYSAEGQPVGPEFQINEITENFQRGPQVVEDGRGGFTVFWESFVADSLGGIVGRSFRADGTARGGEFDVNTTTNSIQRSVVASLLDNGSIATAWESQGQDGDRGGIAVRITSPAGRGDDDFVVNTTVAQEQFAPAIAALADGSFVVSWTGNLPRVGTTPQAEIYAQRVSATGDLIGGETLVNTESAGGQTNSDVAALTGGGFVVTWQSSFLTNRSIKAQQYDANGAPVGGEMLVNSHGSPAMLMPSVIGTPDGGYIISWRSGGVFNDPDLPGGHYAQRYDASGNRVGEEFLIATDASSSPGAARLALTDTDDIVATWQHGGRGDDAGGIRGQLIVTTENEPPTGTVKIHGFAEEDAMLTASSTIADADGLGELSFQWLRDGSPIAAATSETYTIGAADVGTRISVNVSYTDGQGTAASVISAQTTAIADRVDLLGTPNADFFPGTPRPENIIGLAGNDTIAGGGGTDRIFGRDGNDNIFGDNAAAVYYGAAVANQVFRLYQATLDRMPDIGGHTAWSGRIATGQRTLLEVTQGFVGSVEFMNKFPIGTTAETFVRQLYENVLGNTSPDANGLARWTAVAETSRAEAVMGFLDSPQFIQSTTSAANAYAQTSVATRWSDDVFRLYQATLDRAPDVNGQTNWVERLATGASTLLEVAQGFVGSPEFTAAFSVNATSEAFVRLLYKNVLNNENPDAAGLARWINALENGASRAEVVLGFSQSPQFAAETAASLKTWMRAQGVDDRIEGGPGNDLMAGGQFADVFVFDASHDGANTVVDLEPWDYIDLNGFGYANAAAARSEMTQTGADLVFDDQGVTITFRNTMLGDVTDDMIWV